MKKFIFLDTCNWIYLSNGFNVTSSEHDELHLKIFHELKSWAIEGRVIFLVNEVVLKEWERNKIASKKQLKIIENRYKEHLSNLKRVNDFLGHLPKELKELRKILESEYSKKVTTHKEHIQSVEKFLKENAKKISITDDVKLKAAHLAIERKAPFIGKKKNSMADAVILLSCIDYIHQFEKHLTKDSDKKNYTFPESFFVSSNHTDFSSRENKDEIHSDLAPFLEKTNTKFYYNLRDLFKSLKDGFLTEEEENILEQLNYCEVCDYQYPTVEFSECFQIYNPYKTKSLGDPNQLDLYVHEASEEETEDSEYKSNFSEIRTADCNRCGAEYIECVCGELVYIDEYNTAVKCHGCDLRYSVNAEMDRKGMIHSLEYEIIESYRCLRCGDEFESVDEQGMCEECAEYEKLINE